MTYMQALQDLEVAFDSVTTRPELYALIDKISESKKFTSAFSIAFIDELIDDTRRRLGPPTGDCDFLYLDRFIRNALQRRSVEIGSSAVTDQ